MSQEESRNAILVLRFFSSIFSAFFVMGGVWAMSNGFVPPALAYGALFVISIMVGWFTTL